MRWIVVSTLHGDFAPLLPAEARRAGELQQQGVFEQVWPKADGAGAVVLAAAASEGALRERLATMPTVAAGLGGYELVALADPAPSA